MKKIFFCAILIIISISLSGCSAQTTTPLNYDSYDRTDELEDENESLRQSLEEANDQIRDAQSNAWEDYDTMGDTLEGLTETD